MGKILCFVPCYNCAPQIGRVLKQFSPQIAKYIDEILIIDNQSQDGTIDAAIIAAKEMAKPNIKIVRNLENYNLGGSHKAAFAYALANGFSHIVVLHGDDQGNIEDILPLLETGKYKEYDACLGGRFIKQSQTIGYSQFRIFGNHVFNAIFSMVSGRMVQDLGSGLNIFSAAMFRDENIKFFADDLRFNIFLLLNLIKKRHKFMFFPIIWREDDQISNVKLYSQAMKTLKIALQYLFDGTNFQKQDHRVISHNEYKFEIIYDAGSSQ